MAGALCARIVMTLRGPALQPWHTFVPDEMRAEDLNHASWEAYLQTEEQIFRDVRENVTDRLAPAQQSTMNRYYSASRVYPGKFPTDWNRTYVMMPAGPPEGAVVLLHGLTDTPYSLRHIAQRYRERGYVAIGIRLPGHGTVPGALTSVTWQDWMAATRLAVREARHLAGEQVPLHIVGFSNGGALAMKYALDSLEDHSLKRPQRVVLISPMIGVTRFARFAGVAGWPAYFPAFARAAWLNITPEFNPFKYNSFPVNAARQSFLLTQALQKQIATASRRQELGGLPPVLTFQSVLDSTVSTRAVITGLYNSLPANGSELVLFDLNQASAYMPLFRNASRSALRLLLPSAPRNFSTTVISNRSPDSDETQAQTIAAGDRAPTTEKLATPWPADVFSLSHVALPFPDNDPLYGREPHPRDIYGISLGIQASRGERGVLVVGMDALMRMTSDPFFPYLLERIDKDITLPSSRRTIK
ncbi:alpha/beta hydrolase [Erwinia typographi]|nr:alpha/beta hydrolase [Erwinia typographi]